MGRSVLLGVDVGGTRTKLAIVDAGGGPPALSSVFPTPKGGLEAFVGSLRSSAFEALAVAGRQPSDVVGCGVGVPGFVADHGVSGLGDSLSSLEGEDIGPALEDALGVPVALDNDARCVALGEAQFGDFRGERLLSVTLGTGVGVALVVEQALQERNSATHFAGHIPIRPGAAECFCGFSGCLESLVAAARLGSDPVAALASPPGCEPLETWLCDLTSGLNAYIHVYAPDVIVLGGGLANGLGPHLPRLQSSLFASPFAGYHVDVRVTTLAERAGPFGAAALVRPHSFDSPEPQREK